jgi:N utilization substance protein B
VKERRKARLLAVQALYEADTSDHNAVAVVTRLAQDARVQQDIEKFARGLVQGVLEQREEIDRLVGEAAIGWTVRDMAVVDRNILRLATWELLSGEAPMKAVVNEAVELAKLLGSDASARFVNGVLGQVVDRTSAAEDVRAPATD